MRETHEWTDAELDFLETWYVLRGSAFIRARYPHLSADACRQQATRMYLADDLRELHPIREVARDAGVTVRAVLDWLSRRKWAARRCWGTGVNTLLPLPVVRLYHPATRLTRRPTGWLTSVQAAERLNITPYSVRRRCASGALTCAAVRGVMYVDPQSLTAPVTTPPPAHVSALSVAAAAGEHRKTLQRAVAQHVLVKLDKARSPTAFIHESQARQFLSSRGHRAETVETLLRRALALDASRVKKIGSDREDV